MKTSDTTYNALVSKHSFTSFARDLGDLGLQAPIHDKRIMVRFPSGLQLIFRVDNYEMAVLGYFNDTPICTGAKMLKRTHYFFNYHDTGIFKCQILPLIIRMAHTVLSDPDIKATFSSKKDNLKAMEEVSRFLLGV